MNAVTKHIQVNQIKRKEIRMDIQKTLSEHKKWLAGEPGGVRANLYDADLRNAYLRNADLRYADLSHVDLRGADLSGVNLRYADLSHADLRSVDLRSADLSHVDLRYANLRNADLSYVYLHSADLRSANLSGADLSGADLSYVYLHGADLRSTNLSGADLSGADLSGAKNLLSPAKWLADNFEHDDFGYIVYKAIVNTSHKPPEHWRIEPGAYLEEVPNPLPTVECGCGVNFATLAWVRNNYPDSTIWRCRIRWADLPNVVVPYNTDGKARCGRLELLEKVA